MPTQARIARRVIKSRQLFAFMFGTIIGVGWITASGSWLHQAGTAGALIAFGGGALAMLVIGFCFAELSAMMPDSAGTVAFGHQAFGPAGCFLVGWLLIMAYFVFTAYYVISVAWLIDAAGLPLGGPILYRIGDHAVSLGPLSAGLLIAVAVTVSNAVGAGVSAQVQDFLIWALVTLVVVLFAFSLSAGTSANMRPLFSGESSGIRTGAILAVMATTPVWFSGFDVLPQMMRERHESVSPGVIGAVMALGILAALAFYGMVIIATSRLLDNATVEGSDVPVFDAFAIGADSPILAKLVLFAGLLGILSTWNATIFSGSRIIATMAKVGYLPGALGRTNERTGVPILAVVSLGLAPVPLGFLGRGGADSVIAASSLAFLVVFALVCAAVIKLRRDEPGRTRPFRIPFGIWTAWLALALSLCLIAGSAFDSLRFFDGFPLDWSILLLWLLFGGVVWVFGNQRRRSMSDRHIRETIVGVP